MNIRLFYFSLLLFTFQTSVPQVLRASATERSTHIMNVNAYFYGGGNKNWGIASDKEGLIYVANNNGLLEYNGLKWRLYTDAPCVIMRSVAVGEDNRIYTGGFREFGYWERNDAGMLEYNSLSDQIGRAHV